MAWEFPIKNVEIRVTNDSHSFEHIDLSKIVEIPTEYHVGAFRFQRRFHIHKGVDLYCPEGTPVFAVESGTIKNIGTFTGSEVGTPWWNTTEAVIIEGVTGSVVYGEISVNKNLKIGQDVDTKTCIGFVKQVLKKDKGRPMSMLHLELYDHGTEEFIGPDSYVNLKDPTPYLIGIQQENEK